ncbi:serine--tRNA ligase [Candidatus Woesearchaeota archaeon]|nr:serine--tRNA ligase [Candidatus Woesearchaeota archaeon]
MLDIKLFRENPKLIKENLKRKFQEKKIVLVDKVIKLDEEARKLIKKTEGFRHQRNLVSAKINETKKKGGDIKKLLLEAKKIPEEIKKIEEKLEKKRQEIKKLLMDIPNIIDKSVPLGKNDKENKEIEKIGKPKKYDYKIRSHQEIAEELGLADFEMSAKTSGNGFYFLKGDLALLNMALINFSRDVMIKKGYLYVEPPLMIRGKILYGVFSNEEIEEMSYKVEDEDLHLIATSEHSMIGGYIDAVIPEEELPIKITGYTMCFRKEIGSHGIDEKGLFRTHQFNKQEMIVLCKPEDSRKYYDEMLSITKDIFKKLELPTRVLECCSGDLADLKTKSADLEVWSPRKKEYFEVASCSNLTDAQSRRLNIKARGKQGNYYVHTLNNTAIATSRAIVAILENNQLRDGTVNIPKVLWPYMGGVKVLNKKK